MNQVVRKDELNKEIVLHIESVVGKEFNTQRFAKLAVMAMAENPSLAKATKISIMKECVKLARANVWPDGRSAALVPFYNKQKGVHEAVGMVMVQGLLQNARRSGEIESIAAFPVYKNEAFEIMVTSEGQTLTHVPISFGDKGEFMGVYAIAVLKNKQCEIEVMDKKQIKAVEKVSRAKVSPWKGDFFLEMAKKSVLRRLLKRLPCAAHLDEILRMDNQNYDFSRDDSEPAERRPLEDRLDLGGESVEAEATEVETPPETETPPAVVPADVSDLPI